MCAIVYIQIQICIFWIVLFSVIRTVTTSILNVIDPALRTLKDPKKGHKEHAYPHELR